MTQVERKILANEPIIWTGDLSDDCTALWAGLRLRADRLDEDYWWWRVYDMQKGEATVDDSNSHEKEIAGGEIARQKAELIARQYVSELISEEETAKFLITDTFILTNRGIVFTGDITEGIVSVGNTIEFIKSGYIYRRSIIGVEGILSSRSVINNTGLLIQCKSESEMNELRNRDPHNFVATIYKVLKNNN